MEGGRNLTDWRIDLEFQQYKSRANKRGNSKTTKQKTAMAANTFCCSERETEKPFWFDQAGDDTTVENESPTPTRFINVRRGVRRTWIQGQQYHSGFNRSPLFQPRTDTRTFNILTPLTVQRSRHKWTHFLNDQVWRTQDRSEKINGSVLHEKSPRNLSNPPRPPPR